jgi:hypothetical protein
VVDVEYNQHVPGQKRLDDGHAPLFKSFRKNGVISVVENAGCYSPSLIPRQILFINEDSHHLDNGESWVRVIQLHTHKIWKLLQ